MILHEIHTKEKSRDWNDDWTNCHCSYCCGPNKLHYGLNIPIVKKWNSWWVIKYWKNNYLRFTLPFLKK